MTEKIIAIFGTANAKPGDSAYELAYETGKLLAKGGFVIANGGYGGTMLAAAKGATQAGGKIVGVTCSAFARIPNEYISREIVTDSLDERLDTLINMGHGYVILQGGTGTLLELAKVWELKNKGFIKTGKPIILVGRFWKPLVDLIATDDPDSSRHIYQADNPGQVKDILTNCI